MINSLDVLQAELDRSKHSLRKVDEHIKKLVGWDPNEGPLRPNKRRLVPPLEDYKGRNRGFGLTQKWHEAGPYTENETIQKKPRHPPTVCSKLSGPPNEKIDVDIAEEKKTDREQDDNEEDDTIFKKPAISSSVFTICKELPSRKEAISAQNNDELSKARNRRMFGALLTTLQKFRQEETRMKDREEKRAKVERKLEENAKREKEELKKERQELFMKRKRKQAEIRNIELKMQRLQELDDWEEKQKPLFHFILTRTNPHIFYIPKVHSVKTIIKLASSKKIIRKMIERKRTEVNEEVGLPDILKRRQYRSVSETIRNDTTKNDYKIPSVPVNKVPSNTANMNNECDVSQEAATSKTVQQPQENVSEENNEGEVENTIADEEEPIDMTGVVVKIEKED